MYYQYLLFAYRSCYINVLISERSNLLQSRLLFLQKSGSNQKREYFLNTFISAEENILMKLFKKNGKYLHFSLDFQQILSSEKNWLSLIWCNLILSETNMFISIGYIYSSSNKLTYKKNIMLLKILFKSETFNGYLNRSLFIIRVGPSVTNSTYRWFRHVKIDYFVSFELKIKFLAGGIYILVLLLSHCEPLIKNLN